MRKTASEIWQGRLQDIFERRIGATRVRNHLVRSSNVEVWRLQAFGANRNRYRTVMHQCHVNRDLHYNNV